MSDDAATDADIPSVVLAAMKDRMHARQFSAPEAPGHVRSSLGSGDATVHVVDDGPESCTVARPVGGSPDGSVYVLVARVSRYAYEQLRDGDSEPADIFTTAPDISLCAVYEVDGMVENIALVRHFRHGADVPAPYLPPGPFLQFSDEDSPTDDISPSGTPASDGPSPAGFLRRGLEKATGAARRAGRGRRSPGLPPS